MKTYTIDPSSELSAEEASQSKGSFNRRMIREVQAGHWRGDSLSTSQQVMVGLALCQPDLLAMARHIDPASAWARLDDDQRHAVVTWWQDAATDSRS